MCAFSVRSKKSSRVSVVLQFYTLHQNIGLCATVRFLLRVSPRECPAAPAVDRLSSPHHAAVAPWLNRVSVSPLPGSVLRYHHYATILTTAAFYKTWVFSGPPTCPVVLYQCLYLSLFSLL